MNNLEKFNEYGWDFLNNDHKIFKKNVINFTGELVGQFWDGSDSVSKVYQCGNEYIQFNGYYSSYDGLIFDNCHFVEPETYTAVRYNKI